MIINNKMKINKMQKLYKLNILKKNNNIIFYIF